MMAFLLIPRLVAIASIAESNSGSKRSATGTLFALVGAAAAPVMKRSAAFTSISDVLLLGFLCTAIVYHFHIFLCYA